MLDFVIALEALLLPDDSRGDLSYRFRLHGAYYLSSSVMERPGIAEQLNDLYKLRSRLVHGGKYPEQEKLSSVRETARDFARIGLIRAVHDGFPTGAEFTQVILGGFSQEHPPVS